MPLFFPPFSSSIEVRCCLRGVISSSDLHKLTDLLNIFSAVPVNFDVKETLFRCTQLPDIHQAVFILIDQKTVHQTLTEPSSSTLSLNELH
ncbi:hypothetical protein GEMRC1_012030 [Eukaryota sp. GEM-RC1]